MRLVLLLALALAPVWGHGGQGLGAQDPTQFFTNLGSRLLDSELSLTLTQIEVYPSNQYTPAVHRLLQLTANLYDATTNRPITGYPFVPSVFRPLFRRSADNAEVFIAGFREVTNAGIVLPRTAPRMVDLQDSADRAAHIPVLGVNFQSDPDEPLVCGIPLLVGVKKGLPNFNLFALENAVRVTRSLEFRRLPGQPVSQTNQTYTLGISNSFGLQAWNSYGAPFPRPLRLVVAADVTMSLTNAIGPVLGPDGGVLSNRFRVEAVTNLPPGAWPGFSNALSVVSFQVPLLISRVFLSNSVYLSALNRFVATNATDPPNDFPVPRWWLSLRTRVRFALVDIGPNRILDYVNLDFAEPPLDLISAAQQVNQSSFPTGSTDPDPGSFWVTNRLGNPSGDTNITDNPAIPTYGILQQLLVSLGLPNKVSGTFWKNYNANSTTINDEQGSITRFAQQWFFNDTSNLVFRTPFDPVRTFYQFERWEANDPLVHYTIPDLTDLLLHTPGFQWDVDTRSPITGLTGPNRLSDRYLPWGGNPYQPFETSPPTRYNATLKDPLVRGSDDWDFPDSEPLGLAMLGRVHRGTPWQTVYLKSAAVAPDTWMKWTGNTNASDARATRPTNDWQLVSLLDRLLSSNPPSQRLSINEPETSAWLGVLDGLTVPTNSPTSLGVLVLSSNSPQAAVIADAIRGARSAQPNHYFSGLGDILATPELSLGSPWLNTSVVSVITEDAFEEIPSELLPLLRADSVGAIASSNGQPAARFSGYDGYPYAVEASSNLADWVRLGTYYPTNGVLYLTPLPAAGGLESQFYRSVQLP